MKTLKNIGILALLTLLVSCNTNYRMTTRIHKSGKIDRDMYALADSAFLAGDSSRNPFLFSISKEWNVELLNPAIKFDYFDKEGKLNVKVSRSLEGTEEFSFFSPKEKWMSPLASPQEKLEKHFRWFYTYYTYTCNYQQMEEKGPIPLAKYLSKQEQSLLFQGNTDAFQGMNGLELSDELNSLTEQFVKWYHHNLFELSYEVIDHFLKSSGETEYLSRLKNDKDTIFANDKSQEKETECSPGYLCELLDKHYETTFFKGLYEKNTEEMDKRFKQKTRITDLFGVRMKFELQMPGQLISSNTTIKEDETLVWKVDAYRILADKFTLEAESRTPNIWAFCVTGILVLIAGWNIRKLL